MAHREWTERHIRELIQNELGKLKSNGTAPDTAVRMIDMSYLYPTFETGGYSIGGLLMKKWYFYNTSNENIMRAECPVYSPGSFVYSNVTSVYNYDGSRIVGVMLVPPDENPPWYACPIYYSRVHYDDQSESGIEVLANNHNPGMVVYKWTPFDSDGKLVERAFARLRDTAGHVADFNLGILDASAISTEERTETMNGMRLGFVVPSDNNLTNWNLYDWNYKDYYYPDLIMPSAQYTNTICFLYYKSFAYAVNDDYFVS
jgi:hypothetical protein